MDCASVPVYYFWELRSAKQLAIASWGEHTVTKAFEQFLVNPLGLLCPL